MSNEIKKIHDVTRSVREVIYETLKEEILSGQYQSGHHLKERELAEKFGVSTTPLKEALRRLEQEGLVHTQARKGTFVSSSIMNSVEEINWARSALEGVAARLTAAKITESELVRLKETVEKMKVRTEEKNSEQLIKLNESFHEQIRLAAKNNYIYQQIEAVLSFDRFIRKKALAYTDELDRAYKEHLLIFEKIKDRDLDGAEKAMLDHIRRTTSFIMSST